MEDLKKLEVSYLHREQGFVEAIAETGAQARDSQKSHYSLQDQVAGTEQRLSEQIQKLTALHEQNLTAVKDLVTTRSELGHYQSLLNYATSTVTNMELVNAALQCNIDEERTKTALEARNAWEVRTQNLIYTPSDSEATS